MMKFLTKRTVINPLLFTSSCLVAASGLFLMFHYESHFAEVLHEIAALVMLASGIIHIKLNWKPLKNALRGRFIISLGIVAVCVAIMAVTGEHVDMDSLEYMCFEYLNR